MHKVIWELPDIPTVRQYVSANNTAIFRNVKYKGWVIIGVSETLHRPKLTITGTHSL
jgi:hypothetical protein